MHRESPPSGAAGATDARSDGADAGELLTLSEAARRVPGRPSTNCIWRWCRRGVLARGGGRVRLEHRRIGGKIFTAPGWLDEFGRKLADADASYFAARERETASGWRAARGHRRAKRRSDADSERVARLDDVDRELDELGIT